MISKSEKAYVLSSLELGQRLDGRGMEEYRAIKMEWIGESVRVWIGGTSVVGRVRMEVEDGNGRVTSRVQWICDGHGDEHEEEVSGMVDQTLGHGSLRPVNTVIVEDKKGWGVHVELSVMSEDGNVYDALFLCARQALKEARIPLTRKTGHDEFELVDGESSLEVEWPVCVTVNVFSTGHVIDGTGIEEISISSRVVVVCLGSVVFGIRVIGDGLIEMDKLEKVIKIAINQSKYLIK